MNNLEELKKYEFNQRGYYYLNNIQPDCEYKKFGFKKSKRASIIYAFVIDKTIFYIGESVRFSRPLNYHKNFVMKTVRNGIIDALNENKIVEIYVLTENLTSKFSDLEIDLRKSIEAALIKKFNPKWNNQKI